MNESADFAVDGAAVSVDDKDGLVCRTDEVSAKESRRGNRAIGRAPFRQVTVQRFANARDDVHFACGEENKKDFFVKIVLLETTKCKRTCFKVEEEDVALIGRCGVQVVTVRRARRMKDDVRDIESRPHVESEPQSLLGRMLNDQSDARLLPVHRHNDSAVWRDVRLAQEGHFVAQNRIGQVIHDNLSGRTACDGFLAFHNDQSVWRWIAISLRLFRARRIDCTTTYIKRRTGESVARNCTGPDRWLWRTSWPAGWVCKGLAGWYATRNRTWNGGRIPIFKKKTKILT